MCIAGVTLLKWLTCPGGKLACSRNSQAEGKQVQCHQAKPSEAPFQEGAAPDRQPSNGEIPSRWTTAVYVAGIELIKLSPV